MKRKQKHARFSEIGLANAQTQRERWAAVLAGPDRELLDMRASGKTFTAIGVMFGITHQAARYRVHAAERREAIRNSAST